jgi:hypothetical protein
MKPMQTIKGIVMEVFLLIVTNLSKVKSFFKNGNQNQANMEGACVTMTLSERGNRCFGKTHLQKKQTTENLGFRPNSLCRRFPIVQLKKVITEFNQKFDR